MYAMKCLKACRSKSLEKLFINNLLTALERCVIMSWYEFVCKNGFLEKRAQNRNKREGLLGKTRLFCYVQIFFQKII